jgi:hypothetical protein
LTDDTVNAGGDTSLVDIDLDSFSNTFFNPDKVEATPEPKAEDNGEDEVENEDDALATEADKDAEEGEDTSEDDKEDEEEAPKPKKKSAQERINEVVAKQKNAERERDALAQRLRELEATKKPEGTNTPAPTPLQEQSADTPETPKPDALKEDGTPKYKLGEFDPEFIRDLTKHTIKVETEAAKAVSAQETQRKMVEAAQAELQSSWLHKVEEVEKELPDLREKIGELENTFSTIDPNYGEFLAGTIMSCDNGPEIMYYLSQNIGEAQKIVASGPAAATLALGRLDAKFVKAAAQEEKRNKKPSSAPAPAPTATRGQGGRFSTPGDTNDLSAFEREYFQKK